MYKKWNEGLDNIADTQLFKTLVNHTKANKNEYYFYPNDIGLLFNAFNQCNYDELKLVIVGKPSIYKDSHLGLALGRLNKYSTAVQLKKDRRSYPNFSVNAVNFEKLLKLAYDQDDFYMMDETFIETSKQGILFLPTILSKRFTEKKIDTILTNLWEEFTKRVITSLAKNKKNLIFLFLGEKTTKFMSSIFKEGRSNNHAAFLIPGNLESQDFSPSTGDVNGLRSAIGRVEKIHKTTIIW